MNIGKIIAVTNSEDTRRENEHSLDVGERKQGDRVDYRPPTEHEHVATEVDDEVCVPHQPARAAAGR